MKLLIHGVCPLVRFSRCGWQPIGLALLVLLGSAWVRAETVRTETAPAEALPLLRLGCLSGPEMPDSRFLRDIIEPVVQAHGLSLRLDHLPAPAIEAGIFNGELSGDCGRDDLYGSRYQGALKRVDPAFRSETVLLWGRADRRASAPESLRVGLPRGWRMMQGAVVQAGYLQTHDYDTLEQMIDAAVAGEIDVFVTYYAAIQYQEGSLKRRGLVHHRDLLATPVHLYLARPYQSLIPDLSRAIAAHQEHSPYPDYDAQAMAQRGQRELAFGCSLPPQYPLFERIERHYREVFAGLGYGFTLVALPRAREIAEVLSGRLDGSCGRMNEAPFTDNRTLIRVPVPVGLVRPQLMTHRAGVQAIGDIPSGELIAYVRGTQAAQSLFERLPTADTLGVTNVEIGLKMLAAKRIAYLLELDVALGSALARMPTTTPLYRIDLGEAHELFPYLHRKHALLLGPLEQRLRALRPKVVNGYLIIESGNSAI